MMTTQNEVSKQTTDELRTEYGNLSEKEISEGLSDDEYDRKMDLWKELENRADVDYPACPDCGSKSWGQSFGDPKHCNDCGLELGMNQMDLVNQIDAAWEKVL